MTETSRRSPGPTLLDVANAAGVSVGTVSKALNRRGGVGPAIAEQIIETARRLGYQKRQLAPEPAAIASATVVTYDRFLVSGQYYGEILDALLKEGDRRGLDMTVDLLPSDGVEALLQRGLFAAPPAGGLVLLGIDTPDLVDAVAAVGVPTVLVNGVDRRMRMPSVSPDYHFGGWLAARHLLERGHREIIHVTHPWRPSFALRLDGFRDALADFGISYDPARHLLDTGSRALLSLDARQALEHRLMAGPLAATGFVCAADMLAVGVVQALTAAGLRVPQDVSVIGFDDLPVSARCTPPLSSIRIDRAELGRVAIDLLLDRAAAPDRAVRRVGVGTVLVARSSVATCSTAPRLAGGGDPLVDG